MKLLKIIPVVFCMVLVASPVIFHLTMQYQVVSIKKEMKLKLQQLERSELVTLYLEMDEIHWYKQDKELQIGTELFDVKSITPDGDGYLVTGLFDKKEKELKKALEDLARKDQEQQQEKLVSLMQHMYHQLPELTFDAFNPAGKIKYPCFSENGLFHSYPVIIPPPRFNFTS